VYEFSPSPWLGDYKKKRKFHGKSI